ncbi:ABC transporter substrate-binding protein [Allostella vacuolata]|nr:ABC transporter substrate-binding protein [Stella vacuolata]
MRTKACLLAGAALCALAMPASASKQNDTLVWAISQEAPSIDPYYSQTRESVVMYRNVCDNLLYREPKTGEYKAGLALAHRWVNDLTLEFDLRPGVVFHDGRKFSAADVAYTFNHVSNPDNAVIAQSNVKWIQSAEAIGEDKVRVHLKEPFPAALEYVSGPLPILPAGHYDKAPPFRAGGQGKAPKDFGAVKTICTGPYKVKSIDPGEGVTLTKHDRYFDGPRPKPVIGTVQIRTIPDLDTQLALLMTGQLDLIWDVAPDKAKQLQSRKTLSVKQVSISRLNYLQLDAAGRGGKTPMQDLRVRRAMNHAVNKQAIAKGLVGEVSEIIHAACYPTQFGCTQDVPRYDYDPEKAKKLLGEAGVPDGFEVDLYSYRQRDYAEAVIGDLAKVGIKARLRMLQYEVLRPKWRSGEAQLIQGSWASYGMNDTSGSASYFFRGSPDDLAQDKQVIDWLTVADTNTDPAVRKENYRKALERIAEQAYWVPLFTSAKYYAMSAQLDFTPYADDLPQFSASRWK